MCNGLHQSKCFIPIIRRFHGGEANGGKSVLQIDIEEE